MCPVGQFYSEFFGLNVLTWSGLLLLCTIFFTYAHIQIFFVEITIKTNNSIHYGSFLFWQWSYYKYYYLTVIILFQHYSFICIQSNGSKQSYIIPIIQFSDTVKEFQVFPFNTNNSIRLHLFICTEFNSSKYSYVSLTILLISVIRLRS